MRWQALPSQAIIVVVGVKSLKGGEAEARKMLESLPGSQLGRCERCFSKVLLAPSTIDQKKQYPNHVITCRECVAQIPPDVLRPAMTPEAMKDAAVMNMKMKERPDATTTTGATDIATNLQDRRGTK